MGTLRFAHPALAQPILRANPPRPCYAYEGETVSKQRSVQMRRAGKVLLLSALVFCCGERPTVAADDSAQYVQIRLVPDKPPYRTVCDVTDTSNKQIIATLHLYPIRPWKPPYQGTDNGGPFGLFPGVLAHVAAWPDGVAPECWLVSSHYRKMPPMKTAVHRRPK